MAGKSYPAGSYVVKTAQAFRPHVLDMFEPQDHPNDFAYPGGPPIPPYDITGWTLAMQMGVQFDRILRWLSTARSPRSSGLLPPPAQSVTGPSNPAGYLISHQINNSFILINRLLKANADVYWLKKGRRDGWPGPGHRRHLGSGFGRRARPCSKRARRISAWPSTPWPKRPRARP